LIARKNPSTLFDRMWAILHGRNYKQRFAEANIRDRYNYRYSESEPEPWKERIEEIAGQTATTYIVANNHNLGKAAINALELIHMFEGRKIKAPPQLVAHYLELSELTVGV
jgi:uncharacterized protein YecE (DUF72 family)